MQICIVWTEWGSCWCDAHSILYMLHLVSCSYYFPSTPTCGEWRMKNTIGLKIPLSGVAKRLVLLMLLDAVAQFSAADLWRRLLSTCKLCYMNTPPHGQKWKFYLHLYWKLILYTNKSYMYIRGIAPGYVAYITSLYTIPHALQKCCSFLEDQIALRERWGWLSVNPLH